MFCPCLCSTTARFPSRVSAEFFPLDDSDDSSDDEGPHNVEVGNALLVSGGSVWHGLKSQREQNKLVLPFAKNEQLGRQKTELILPLSERASGQESTYGTRQETKQKGLLKSKSTHHVLTVNAASQGAQETPESVEQAALRWKAKALGTHSAATLPKKPMDMKVLLNTVQQWQVQRKCSLIFVIP